MSNRGCSSSTIMCEVMKERWKKINIGKTLKTKGLIIQFERGLR
jgi:hypothetical protein